MKFRRIEWAIAMKNLYWIFKCLLAFIASIAVLIFLVFVNAQSHKETQSTKQAVYDNMIEQIESANSEPVIVLGGKYRATRCEKPYEHCIKICKLLNVGRGK